MDLTIYALGPSVKNPQPSTKILKIDIVRSLNTQYIDLLLFITYNK
jgi:hypothetical protein